MTGIETGGERVRRQPIEAADRTIGKPCPVCRARGPTPFAQVDGRHYRRCGTCEACFLDPGQRLATTAEHAHYLTHRNDPGDTGYRNFLARLAGPLLDRLAPGSSGLDYGCGPGPALAAMLREAGHRVVLYDPFFEPDQAVLDDSYDFVTCTEVAEHFHRPAEEFDRLDRLLRPGGLLAVMTSFRSDDVRFADWHYRRDPTHVVFNREATFRTLSAQRGWDCTIPADNVALMRKSRDNG